MAGLLNVSLWHLRAGAQAAEQAASFMDRAVDGPCAV